MFQSIKTKPRAKSHLALLVAVHPGEINFHSKQTKPKINLKIQGGDKIKLPKNPTT